MKQDIAHHLAEIVKTLFGVDAEIAVEIPEDSRHGEYTSNIAMLLASRLKAPPMQLGQKIVDAIKTHQTQASWVWFDHAEIVAPGFINFHLSGGYFGNQLQSVLEKKERYGAKSVREFQVTGDGLTPPGPSGKKGGKKGMRSQEPELRESGQSSHADAASHAQPAGNQDKNSVLALRGKRVMVEFAHPNTHKAFHIGHLRNITTGESVVRLLESQGNHVIRVNYQGDVGMHIAKALYGILQANALTAVRHASLHERVTYLGEMYAAGSKAFEESEEAKQAIGVINKQIYAKDPAVYAIYQETREWSLEYFAAIYARVGTHYDRLYFESEVHESGKARVLEGLKQGIFEESDGAIIFNGKAHGIDTRVFITREGNPTYEGKEVGLAPLETTEFGVMDRIIHVVGPEQASFFKVTFQAEELLGIVQPGQQQHLVYGWVKLKHGKMSSRTGQVVLGEWLLDEAKKSIYQILDKNASDYQAAEKETIAEAAAVAAVKYAFLRVGTNQEIAFDLKESVSFDGDSGPYLLYTYARAQSVLRRASLSDVSNLSDLNPEERVLARRISQFPEVVEDAATRFAPNVICTYLFHLASEFNAFYAKHKIGDDAQRLALTMATAQVLKNGLYLLGISTVERM